MSGLHPPLTPPDCDLRDFQFMPLDAQRLRDSDLAALETPEACWSAVLLWCASWHQVPAASLPNDDRILAQLAGFGRIVKEWQKVKKGALRGWIICSDGRLYHPVVAEKANDAWSSKHKQRWKTECARIKKHNQRHGTNIAYPTLEQFLSPDYCDLTLVDTASLSQETISDLTGELMNCPPGQIENVPRDKYYCPEFVPRETHSKGELTGTVNLKTKPSSSVVGKPEPVDNFLPELRPPPEETGDYATVDPTRATQIAIKLRAAGIQGANGFHPDIIAWAENPKVTDVMLDELLALAKQRKPTGTVNVAYLVRMIGDLLNPPPPRETKPRNSGWHLSDEGTVRKGSELGMCARMGETFPQFRERIWEEIRRREKSEGERQ